MLNGMGSYFQEIYDPTLMGPESYYDELGKSCLPHHKMLYFHFCVINPMLCKLRH